MSLRRIGEFEVVREVGRGGMGVVYEARDARLERKVAIKLLSLDHTRSPEARERLLREARAAASLDHPNVCPVFQVGETGEGELFVAMPLYRGETLQQRLSRGRLSTRDALVLGRQLVDGLAHGHEQGVVHRDVKPANLFLVDEGSLRILDFGIAKRSEDESLTATGTLLGTPGYMAPEQVRGGVADVRADVWAVGVVLYEMLTGVSPFRRDTTHATLFAIVHEEPRPSEELVPGLPPRLAALIRGCLQKAPEHRHPTMRLVQRILEQIDAGTEAGSTDSTLIATASPTPVAPAVAAAHGVAVLPFSDLSPGRDQDYFCEGIAEELINVLARVEKLSVVSRTSSFRFRSADAGVRQIAGELGVRYLLEGSVRKAGTALRISVQLIDAVDDRPLWSGRFDRELHDVFAVQEEIARETVRALEVTLSGPESRRLRRPAARRPDAYDRYLEGRQAFYRGGSANMQRAVELFQAAVDLDPGYALAHAGLADAYVWLFLYRDRSADNLDRSSWASARAVELDPELAEAHTSRGLALWIAHRYEEAWAEFEEATRLSPHLFEAWYLWGYASFTHDLGRAAELLDEARRIRPEDHQTWSLLAKARRGLGEEAAALAAHRQALELVERLRRLGNVDQRPLVVGANALIALGERERGLEWAEEAVGLAPGDAMLFYAVCAFVRAGEHQRALEVLESIVEAGFDHREWTEKDPDLDPLREDPRFRELLERMT